MLKTKAHSLWLAHGALFGANLIYGANYSIAKEVMEGHIAPEAFILLRVLGATVLFALFLPWIRWIKLQKQDYWRFGICASMGIAANQLFFFEGLHLTSPINAAILLTINPIGVLLVAALIERIPITAPKLGGVFLGICGSLLLIFRTGDFSAASDHLLGNVFIILNAICYAFYLVLAKPLFKRYSVPQIMLILFMLGIPLVVPFGASSLAAVPFTKLSGNVLWQMAFVVVGSTFLAYLFNAYGLKRLNAAVVSVYIYLQPILATMIALMLSADKLQWVHALSGILVFSGVYLSSKESNQP